MKRIIQLSTIAALALSVWAFAPQQTNKGYQPGDSVSDFKLKNVDGKMVSMANYKNAKGFIIVFTCNHCPFSKAYESRIIALDKEWSKKGYPVIAINPNDPSREPEDSYEKMQEVAKTKGYTFPYLVDQTQEVAKRFGATRTPHVYVLKREGAEQFVRYIGAIDDNYEDEKSVKDQYVQRALNELVNGSAVSVETTKAIGCGIKWKK